MANIKKIESNLKSIETVKNYLFELEKGFLITGNNFLAKVLSLNAEKLNNSIIEIQKSIKNE